MYIYACAREFDGYFLGMMANLYAQFTEFYTVFQTKHWTFITELKKFHWPVNAVIWCYMYIHHEILNNDADCYLTMFNIYVSSKVKFISAKASNF